MNAQQRRVEKRLKARSLYPLPTDFPSHQIASDDSAVFRTNKKGKTTYRWPQDGVNAEVLAAFEEHKHDLGFELNLPAEIPGGKKAKRYGVKR